MQIVNELLNNGIDFCFIAEIIHFETILNFKMQKIL